MKAIYCAQGSDSAEWLDARCGRVTASRMNDVMNYTKKGEPGCDRKDYMSEIICERLTGLAAEHYVSPEMRFGTEHETEARTAYEIAAETMVDHSVGFVYHPHIELSGASPDGMVGDDGMLECKVPKTVTHLTWAAMKIPPAEHVDQMQWQMACTGRQWVDFCSFDPRLPKRYQIFIVRLMRDEGRIAELNDGVRLFLREVDAAIASLEKIFPALPEPLATRIDDPEMSITDADIRMADPTWKG